MHVIFKKQFKLTVAAPWFSLKFPKKTKKFLTQKPVFPKIFLVQGCRFATR